MVSKSKKYLMVLIMGICENCNVNTVMPHIKAEVMKIITYWKRFDFQMVVPAVAIFYFLKLFKHFWDILFAAPSN